MWVFPPRATNSFVLGLPNPPCSTNQLSCTSEEGSLTVFFLNVLLASCLHLVRVLCAQLSVKDKRAVSGVVKYTSGDTETITSVNSKSSNVVEKVVFVQRQVWQCAHVWSRNDEKCAITLVLHIISQHCIATHRQNSNGKTFLFRPTFNVADSSMELELSAEDDDTNFLVKVKGQVCLGLGECEQSSTPHLLHDFPLVL